MKRLILIVFGIALALNTPLSAQQAGQNIPVLPVIPELESTDPDYDPAWYLKGDGYLQRQVEPTIAVSTRNPDHVLSFFVDYRAVDVGSDIGLGEETQTFALAMKTTNMMLAGLIPLPKLPLVQAPPIAAAEAWVGGSASHDGGLTWSGFFMPGASFDNSLISAESPVYGLEAATDPVAVAGPCGYVYVVFMAFTRGDESKMVVARFQDLNDSESGKTWQYQGTFLLEAGNNAENGFFLDKGHINLDIFRDDADFSNYAQYFPDGEEQCGHRLYTSYSTFNGLDKDGKFQSKINFATSVDRGETWKLSKIQQPYTQNQGSFIAVDPRPGQPKITGGGSVYLVWRHFYSPDSIVMIKTTDYGKKWSKPVELIGDIPMQTFDQPTIQAIDGNLNSPRELAFRSNAFPTAVVAPYVDEGVLGDPTDDTLEAAIYVAWQELVDIDRDSPTTFGKPTLDNVPSSPRIVMVRSDDGGESWTSRVAVDTDRRDDNPDAYPPAGFGALPTARDAGPQVKPWLSFGGGELALGYSESRGMYRRGEIDLVDENGDPDGTKTIWYHEDADLSANGFISDIDRVMDFRVAMLDPSTGQLDESIQVSRYPVSYTAVLDDGEGIDDIAPVFPELCDRVNGPPEYCQPSLNFVNKNHSGSGHAAFMGDYPGMTPILPFLNDYNELSKAWEWRWAVNNADVPYPAFHVVFPDSRHLIPPVVGGIYEWQRYPDYSYPTADTNYECRNLGSRNVDVLTAKVNAELVLSAPTTYKKGSPGDPTWGYPITVFNQSDDPRFYRLQITEGSDFASFVVEDILLEENLPSDIDIRGVVEIFAFSSTSQMVYVNPAAEGQIVVEVNQVDCTEIDGEYVCDDMDGERGFVTLNPDPSNPETNGSELQLVKIVTEGVEEYTVPKESLDALNPFVKNPFVKNPFVKNPFVKNPFVKNTSLADVEVIDTTWSVQATADSGAGTYLPVINIDNADEFLKKYAFQLLIFKNAYHGTFAECETFNVPHAQIISNVSQSPDDGAENPFVKNPFVKNPFVKNPFVKNPFVKNSAITVAPADGVTLNSQESSATAGAKNLIFDEEGTLRVPRVPEKIYITLRAFKLDNLVSGDLEYKPKVDKPAFSFVPARCTTSDCIMSLSPDLVPTDIEVTTLDYANLPARTIPTDPDEPLPEAVQVPLGETITFNFKVRNLGNVPAVAENRDLRHAFYLSKNPTVDPGNDVQSTSSDKILLLGPGASPPDHVVTIDSLPPGDEFDPDNFEQFSSVTVEIPYDINPADFDYLILFMDDYREVSENNEINNQHAMLIDLVKLNHPPTFTPGGEVQVLEDSGPYSDIWAFDIDNGDPNSGQSVSFEVTPPSNPQLFTEGGSPKIDAGGVLSFTPAPDRYGTATVDVVLFDNGDDGTDNPGSVNQSPEVTFTIEVLPINDPPSFEPGIDSSFNISVSEDAGLVSIVNWATNITAGPYEDDDQDVIFSVPTVDNPALFTTQPSISSDGTLSFLTTPHLSGTALLSVYLQDTGGTLNGGVNYSDPPVQFTITVNPVADYIFDGFFNPWTEVPPYAANAGSAIPLKWRYMDPANPSLPIESGDVAPSVIANGPFECIPPMYPEGEGETIFITGTPYDPGSSGLRYSPASKEWQVNWETDPDGAGCYYLRVHVNHPNFSDEVSPPLLIILN